MHRSNWLVGNGSSACECRDGTHEVCCFGLKTVYQPTIIIKVKNKKNSKENGCYAL